MVEEVSVGAANMPEMNEINKFKISDKVGIAAIVAFVFVTLLLFGLCLLSYAKGAPLVFYDKKFGIDLNESKNARTELDAYRKETSQTIAELRRQIDQTRSEMQVLKNDNEKLIAQQQEYVHKESIPWSPVDDLTFFKDGTFYSVAGAEGRGKWAAPESELTLLLIEFDSDGPVFATNLPPPRNKIRVSESMPVSVTMKNWQYQLTMQSYFPYRFEKPCASLRIERRTKN